MYNTDENTKSKLKYIFTAPRRSSSHHAHARSQCKKYGGWAVRNPNPRPMEKSHDEVHPRQYMQAVGWELWNPWNHGNPRERSVPKGSLQGAASLVLERGSTELNRLIIDGPIRLH